MIAGGPEPEGHDGDIVIGVHVGPEFAYEVIAELIDGRTPAMPFGFYGYK